MILMMAIIGRKRRMESLRKLISMVSELKKTNLEMPTFMIKRAIEWLSIKPEK